MKVLITNSSLDLRTGTDLYVRDLAVALIRRGHAVVACSSRLGEVADELRKLAVPVIDEPAACPVTPDIIHGHHHVDTMGALCAFPGVPAVSVCHGWVPWEEMPPRHPRIARYVAVDETCRDRLVLECGIDARQVDVLLNFVDLDRFRPRDPLPETPRRALVFSNLAQKNEHLAVIVEACRQMGLSLDLMGLASGSAQAFPERVLGRYDIVFAKARSAIEAMAVGAAVVLTDQFMLGEMVTRAGFDRLRPLNFGIRTMTRQLSLAPLLEEMARYDAADAATVSSRVRADAGLDDAVARWIALYESVLAQPPVSDPVEELRAVSRYLRELAPRLRDYYSQVAISRDLTAQLARLRQQGAGSTLPSGG